ncbi:MAG: pyridoxamine 5'-phosphate oxidase family protein [Candidatus Lokiarchaeota archaeon]|nr:pyridoxamine 5'-phosphate oxidase family protein [Candidatus Lokiarchaeota archaeon]
MVKLTPEMKEGLVVPGKGGSLVYLCTSSIDGKPNIAGMRFVDTVKDDKILISDMFLLKTKANIKENPECIIAICHPLDSGRDWVFKGKAIDIEYGFPPDFDWYGVKAKEILDGWGDWHNKEPPDEVPPDVVYSHPAQRGVVVLHVEEVYSIEKGKTGEKIQ